MMSPHVGICGSLAVVASSLVISQPALERQVPDEGTMNVSSTGYEVLHSQLDGASGEAFWDIDYVSGEDNYDAAAADDFIVTSPAGWDVRHIFTPGMVQAGEGIVWVNTTFYADAGGLPGAPLPDCDFPANLDFTTDGTGDLSINVDCNAPAGVVWFSQQVRTLDSEPFHHWSTRNSAAGNPFVWKNPGNGFGTGCIDWTPAELCGSDSADTLFEVYGQENGSGGVPAIGPLGIVFLLLILGCSSAYVLGRGALRS